VVGGIRKKIQGRKVQFEKNQSSEKLASCLESDLLHGAHLVFFAPSKVFHFFVHRIRYTAKTDKIVNKNSGGHTNPGQLAALHFRSIFILKKHVTKT
jgi:hypothetical protein